MNNHDQEKQVQKIRAEYAETTPGALDELKALDARVKTPANVFAGIYGGLGAIIMGAGMSLVMTDIGAFVGLEDGLIPGIVIGVVGLVLSCTAYPIYKAILKSRKKKYAARILALSDELMQQ